MSKILFDEAHSEAWTIRPEFANAMQPAHPGDASYARAAAALADRDFTVQANVGDLLSGATLSGCDVLVIAHPSDPKWERTTGTGSPRLTAERARRDRGLVNDGGGLVVLGETEQDKYGNNLNELLERFGLKLRDDTVQDYEHCDGRPDLDPRPSSATAPAAAAATCSPRVREACFYRATTIAAATALACSLARTGAPRSPARRCWWRPSTVDGRVVVLGDSDLFGDDCIGALDHRGAVDEHRDWAAERSTTAERRRGRRRRRLPPDAELLRADRDDQRARAAAGCRMARCRPDADRDAAAVARRGGHRRARALAAEFPHHAEYLSLAIEDLRALGGRPAAASPTSPRR